MERYVVRKEFFGALVYDREEDCYLAFDEEIAGFLADPVFLADTNDITELLFEEGFFVEGHSNYEYIETPFTGETLSAPVRIHFYYTTKCNLNCAHCFTKKDNVGEEMPLSLKIEMLNQMKKYGINEILIGGGEPFAKDDIFEFIEECQKRNIVTKVFTNGLLLNEEIVRKMQFWNLKYLSISVDGYNDDEYQRVRGIRGLDIIKRNVKLLKQYCSFPIAISITVNSENYRNASGYLKYADDCGADRIKIRPTKPNGNILDNPRMYLTPIQYLYFIKNMQQVWNRDYKGKFRLDYSWGDSRLYYDETDNSMKVQDIIFPYEGYGCFAGKGSIVISASGKASPCGFLPKGLQYSEDDTLTKRTLKQIWDTGVKFNYLRHLKGNMECMGCEYYGTCRGGCIARILYEKKPINSPDPWCLKKYFPCSI